MPQKAKKSGADLESQVKVWSDYLRARYHPRTNVVVQDYQHGDIAVNPFDTFGMGYSQAGGAELMDEIEDRVRSVLLLHLFPDSILYCCAAVNSGAYLTL